MTEHARSSFLVWSDSLFLVGSALLVVFLLHYKPPSGPETGFVAAATIPPGIVLIAASFFRRTYLAWREPQFRHGTHLAILSLQAFVAIPALAVLAVAYIFWFF